MSDPEGLSGDEVVIDLTGIDTIACLTISQAIAYLLIRHGKRKYLKQTKHSKNITEDGIQSIKIHDDLFTIYALMPIAISNHLLFPYYSSLGMLTWLLCCQFALLFWLQSMEFNVPTPLNSSNPVASANININSNAPATIVMFSMIPWYSIGNSKCGLIPLCKFNEDDLCSYLWLCCCIPSSGAVVYCMSFSGFDFVSESNLAIGNFSNIMFCMSCILSFTILILHLLCCQCGIKGIFTCDCNKLFTCRKFCALYWFGLCFFCFFYVTYNGTLSPGKVLVCNSCNRLKHTNRFSG